MNKGNLSEARVDAVEGKLNKCFEGCKDCSDIADSEKDNKCNLCVRSLLKFTIKGVDKCIRKDICVRELKGKPVFKDDFGVCVV